MWWPGIEIHSVISINLVCKGPESIYTRRPKMEVLASSGEEEEEDDDV